jgi:glycine/D-amino acid oxidase-like deaminating enzyme
MQPEVVVIGGGISGLACGWQLARLGARVAIMEGRTPDRGASTRNAGIYMPGKDPESMESLEQLNNPATGSLAWRVTGHLALATSADTLRAFATEAARNAVSGRTILLNRHEAEDLLGVPLATCVLGARWYPSAVIVEPTRLVAQLRTLATGAGVWTIRQTARAIRYSHGLWRVSTDTGRIQAPQVVVAAGAWSAELLPSLSDHLVPRRAQMLETEPLAEPFFRCAMALNYGDLYWRQHRAAIIVGGCRRYDVSSGDSKSLRVTAPVQTAIESSLRNVSPVIPPFKVARRWAGLLEVTSDGRPIVGHVPSEHDGLWIMAGYNGHGLPRALGWAPRLAATVAGSTAEPLPPDLSPSRFLRVAAPTPPIP